MIHSIIRDNQLGTDIAGTGQSTPLTSMAMVSKEIKTIIKNVVPLDLKIRNTYSIKRECLLRTFLRWQNPRHISWTTSSNRRFLKQPRPPTRNWLYPTHRAAHLQKFYHRSNDPQMIVDNQLNGASRITC